MRRVTIYLSEEEFQELRRRAARRGMTISALVRLSVARIVEREGEQEGLGRIVEGLERLRMEVPRRAGAAGLIRPQLPEGQPLAPRPL
jgi:hypothetical protein